MGEHGGVRNHGHIGFEQILMGFDEGVQVRTANFLFTFDEVLDIHRKLPARVQECFSTLEVDENLSLIVRCSPGIELAIADGRFKRC